MKPPIRKTNNAPETKSWKATISQNPPGGSGRCSPSTQGYIVSKRPSPEPEAPLGGVLPNKHEKLWASGGFQAPEKTSASPQGFKPQESTFRRKAQLCKPKGNNENRTAPHKPETTPKISGVPPAIKCHRPSSRQTSREGALGLTCNSWKWFYLGVRERERAREAN
jgi:hypothetical protein